MGFLTNALRLLPASDLKASAAAATITPYGVGYDGQPYASYYHNAKEGYMADELVYQCVDIRANAAGEPPICAWRITNSAEEKITDKTDPALALLNNPNPFMTRAMFWSNIVMHLDVGGNAYIEKVRSPAGKVVELWLLRPDRMKVIPDPNSYIGGYTYQIGPKTVKLNTEDVIHLKTRNPLDDFYGLPPLAVLAERVDLDIWTRKFTAAFFRNAGVPSGLLNIQKVMSAQERQDTQRRFRELYGGEQGWHKVAVMDGGITTYTPMGLPLGANGAALPELNEINEARILGVYGIPLSLIPTMAGAKANRGQTASVSERAAFWEQTMVPLFRELDSALSMGLRDDFPQYDRFEHDLSRIHALQEDVDKRHERIRADWNAGIVTWTEARQAMGYPEEPDEPGVVVIMNTMTPMSSADLLDPTQMLLDNQEPAPAALPPGPPPAPVSHGRTNGAVTH